MTNQKTLEKMEAFIRRYITFPDGLQDQSLVCALWAAHTWIYDRFSATPYLAITAAVRQSGKTILGETLMLLSRNPKMFATLRMLAVVRMIEEYTNSGVAGITFYFDEAEKLAGSRAGDERSLLATGYRRGATHPITSGRRTIEFPVYAPKCFILIGDLTGVLKDRSITIRMERAEPARDFHSEHETATPEGLALMQSLFDGIAGDIPHEAPTFLRGRDREIATPLWSLALALGVDKRTRDRLTAILTDLVALKLRAPKRAYRNEDAEVLAQERISSSQALADLQRVLRDGERVIYSAVAVERMLALPDAPWRYYVQGEPLTTIVLAGLLAPFDLKPTPERIKGKQLRGYRCTDIRAAKQA